MTLNYAVPYGKIKLVLYDHREKSSTKGELMELFWGLTITFLSVSLRGLEWF